MINFVVDGKVPSKSNQYMIIKLGQHASLAKKAALKSYENKFYLQVPADYRGLMITGLIRVRLAVYYPSQRSDLDNAAKVVLDCLQIAKVIKNDNKVVELNMTKHIDKDVPRCEIFIEEIV